MKWLNVYWGFDIPVATYKSIRLLTVCIDLLGNVGAFCFYLLSSYFLSVVFRNLKFSSVQPTCASSGSEVARPLYHNGKFSFWFLFMILIVALLNFLVSWLVGVSFFGFAENSSICSCVVSSSLVCWSSLLQVRRLGNSHSKSFIWFSLFHSNATTLNFLCVFLWNARVEPDMASCCRRGPNLPCVTGWDLSYICL